MNTEKKRTKILLLNAPISLIRSYTEPLKNEFDFFLAGDVDQFSEIVTNNSDIAALIICESESLDQSKEILKNTRSLIPNAARALFISEADQPDALELLNTDLVNQLIPDQIDKDHFFLRLCELNHIFRLKWQIAEIEKIAITDVTTGLPNNRFFQSTVDMLFEESAAIKDSFALLLLDVDQFRSFNETFGFGVGDKVLSNMGERIRQIIPNCLNVFRLSSDEFAILIRSANFAQTQQFSEQLRRSFENIPFVGPNQRPAYITVSIGAAVYPDHGVDWSDIMTMAKGALNQAKRRGRNQTVVSHLC